MPASDVSTNILIPNSRILYIDPNDIYGKVNGVPITPDYSDMCISFDLECEIVTRYKLEENFGESSDGKFNISFTKKVGVKGKWASLLQGEAYQNDNFLTTYYTDINYDNFRKETVVEGLGVESVSISFESYYSPNITIKFVDHRGSALFGREEATHFNDKLTIDNIFGAFFTIPYPKFRLQVKGFYGKAVTYQLSCTSFKGSLNSQTGNFEAVATFIGYSYSILTDIPFEYLVAAPYCEYVGKDYWEAHRMSDEWRMEGGVEGDVVPTFFELFQRINAAFTKDGLLQAVTNREQEVIDDANNEIDCLTQISEYYVRFLNSIDDVVQESPSKVRNYESGNPVEDAQILFMSKEIEHGEWIAPRTWWNYLMQAVENYNYGFKDHEITDDLLPTAPTFDNIKFTPFFVRSADGKDVVFKDLKDSTVAQLSQVTLNGNRITPSLAEALIDYVNKKHSRSNILPNVYLLNCNGLMRFLEKRTKELKTMVNEINKQTERNYVYLAIENLGIIPYLSNIFKLIMCHIETFVEMMLQCFENIKVAEMAGQRTAAYLGINDIKAEYNGTDVWSPMTNIPPWPSVNRKDASETQYAELERNNTLGWVGDFSDAFEEVKLIRALYLACRHTVGDPGKTQPETVEFLYAPILPNDLNNNFNPFIGGEKTLSSMAGMVGIRAAQIFGVGEGGPIDDDTAKVFGQVDALNYYRFLGGSKTILGEVLEQCDGNLADVLYDIMLCNPSADKYGKCIDDISVHDFEFATDLFKDIERHPIYKEVSFGTKEVLMYTYMPTKSHYGIVPANTRKNTFYLNSKSIDGTRESGHYFKVDVYKQGDYLKCDTFIHRCASTQLFEDYNNPSDKTKYINTEMYTIVTDALRVSGILNRYNEMKSGNITVTDETFKLDLNKVLDRYWYTDDSYRYMYMTNCYGYFTKSYKDNGIEETMLLGDKFDTSTDVFAVLDKLLDSNTLAFFNNDTLKLNETAVSPNDLIIPTVDCIVNGNWFSLFGIDFYYMQNMITDPEVKTKVKALLFLHTLFYNKDFTLKWDIATVNHSTITRIPFGLAALYGGLLWRHNFILNNGQDPIQYGKIYKPAYDPTNKIEYSLFSISNGKWRMQPQLTSGVYTYRVFSNNQSTNYIFKHKPDYVVANELIRVFNEFINNQWKIISRLELRLKGQGEFKNGEIFNNFVSAIYDSTKESLQTDYVGEENSKVLQSNVLKSLSENLEAFSTYYSFLFFYYTKTKDKISLWLNADNKEVQDALRSTYLSDCIELRTMSTDMSLSTMSKVEQYTDIAVNTANIKSYLTGFAEQLNVILNNTNNDKVLQGKDLKVIEETPEFNREVALPIYIYLKMLWDKWLVSLDLSNHMFMVKNFGKNFIFIDSFYRNIAHRFMCNCQILLECYNNNATSNLDISVFKFIGDITTKHNCLFVSVPDFITDWAHLNPRKAAESLKSVFKAIPYSEIPAPEENNKFVTIYIPKLSENPSELNNFRDDGFNIWSYNDDRKNDSVITNKTETLPEVFCSIDELDLDVGGDLSRYGYYVPAFGLSYARQNNHIFKDMKLSMDAPIMTSAVVNTLSHNALKSANNTHRIAYIGQDIYPVFSNYSYICEFEMMGCAQIQPLMYFQLMNVPMWRGTYIILGVSHNMAPGTMTTRVKAMKLANRVVPYSNAWFTKNPNFDEEELRKLMCLDKLSEGGFINSYTVQAPTNDNSNDNNTGQENIVVEGSGSLLTEEGRAKYIYIWFKNKNIPSNNILGIMANMYRKTDGMVFPYNKWIVDQHRNGKREAGGGLRHFLASNARRMAKTYNVGNDAIKIIDTADQFAKTYKGKPLTPESAKAINNAVPPFPIPIDVQLQKTYDDIKGTPLAEDTTLTPQEASTYFRTKLNNPGVSDDNGRWKKYGGEIKKMLSM